MSTTPELYRDLAAALRQRREAIADREHYQRNPAGHLERLKAATAEIEALAEQLPARQDPQLAHFLQRCSYDKALAFLEPKSS